MPGRSRSDERRGCRRSRSRRSRRRHSPIRRTEARAEPIPPRRSWRRLGRGSWRIQALASPLDRTERPADWRRRFSGRSAWSSLGSTESLAKRSRERPGRAGRSRIRAPSRFANGPLRPSDRHNLDRRIRRDRRALLAEFVRRVVPRRRRSARLRRPICLGSLRSTPARPREGRSRRRLEERSVSVGRARGRRFGSRSRNRKPRGGFRSTTAAFQTIDSIFSPLSTNPILEPGRSARQPLGLQREAAIG